MADRRASDLGNLGAYEFLAIMSGWECQIPAFH
jgi:hypothetical protein